MNASYCLRCGTVVRVRGGVYVGHYVNGTRCPGSGEPVGGTPPPPPTRNPKP